MIHQTINMIGAEQANAELRKGLRLSAVKWLDCV